MAFYLYSSQQPLIEVTTYLYEIQSINDKETAFKLLSESEQQRVKRYKSERMKNQALFFRTTLRETLSRYCDDNELEPIQSNQWQFEIERHGKPRLIQSQFDATGIQFNISHSGDYLLIGVFHSKLPYRDILFGVDIERERQNTDLDAILHRYFSEIEVSSLLALPKDKQRKRFFDLWALKESYIKATGKGLATRLDSFSFTFDDTNGSIELIAENEHKNLHWQSFIKQSAGGYRLSVSVATKDKLALVINF
ncbi:4'-phosphopantetheinyl transferase family protein [Parashewanella hymeniacidonis]|uniref:4'-phosphopantetheinyl transferase family protein n=1 Tax=Parashewanella hymeniacidonis TaxID=2807618 RepID=UPI001EF5727F|nr:4'-phosphopantetheinyl transferase superfamily protein [Parashewanella hymeniacidonis]